MDSTSMQTSLVISTKHAAEEFGEPSPQHARIASSSESEDDSDIAVVGHARLEDDDDDAYLPSVQTAARVARARRATASSSLKAFAVKQRMARVRADRARLVLPPAAAADPTLLLRLRVWAKRWSGLARPGESVVVQQHWLNSAVA